MVHFIPINPSDPGSRFNMSSYQYRKSHCGDKTVVRSSYLHSGISYTGKMTSLYWFSPLVPFIARSSPAIVLSMRDIQGLVVHKEWFQLPVCTSSVLLKRRQKNANRFSWQNLSSARVDYTPLAYKGWEYDSIDIPAIIHAKRCHNSNILVTTQIFWMIWKRAIANIQHCNNVMGIKLNHQKLQQSVLTVQNLPSKYAERHGYNRQVLMFNMNPMEW